MGMDHKKPLQVEDLYACLTVDKSETIGLTLEKYLRFYVAACIQFLIIQSIFK